MYSMDCSTAEVHEKFLLHTDGTEQFGSYSRGPAFWWESSFI